MNNAKVILLAGFVSLVSLGIFLLINRWLEKRRETLQRRLRSQSTASDTDLDLASALPTQPQGFSGRMDAAFNTMIQRTGLDAEPAQAAAFIALVGVSLATVLFLWRGELWLSVLGLFVGGGGTFVVYYVLQGRYHRQISEQLPDAFYLLARSLRAGLSMEQAIALTGQQGAEPLASEFRRCAAQLQLGLSVPSALEVVARRVQMLDFDVFVSTVSLHHTMGGNLPQLLDRLAATTRDRNHFRSHFRTATALSRATAIGIGLFTPLLLLYYAIFPPEHVRAFFESSTGWTAVSVACGLQLIGIVWMYRLLSVEY